MKREPKMVDIQVPESVCPFCFILLDTVNNTDGGTAPDPGDFTVCLGCASVMRFDENLQLVAAKFEDIPIQDRAKFATLKMCVEEIKNKNGPIPPKPWSRT
jgi:hypothetical protein